MNTERKRYDLTSADTKIIGTDYQFFYFINELLKLKKGQQLGYEVKDDVHIDLSCGKTTLIQLKHTTQKQANGETINLTELDDDLLHTINNWILAICDENDGRKSYDSQKNYVKNTTFVLATNKLIDKKPFIISMKKANGNNRNFKEFIVYLENLLKNCKGESSKECISNILSMNRVLLKEFISSIKIEVQADTIVNDIRESISNKYIRDEKINDVFSDIFFELKVSFFDKVNSGQKFIVTYEEWQPKAIAIFEKYQTTNLPIREFQKPLPSKLQEQPFIQELIEIGDIDEENIEEMAEYTGFMLEVEMNFKEWYDNGEITLQQKEKFHEIATTYWKNSHKKWHRKTISSNDIDHAIQCINEIRDKELKFDKIDFNIQLSNGEFYHLSNNRKIGWLKHWEERYKR